MWRADRWRRSPPARAEGTFDIPAGAHFNQDKLAKISEFFRNEVATGKIAGANVLIQQHGKPVYHETFGVQDVVSKTPISDKTIFRLFSMTKAITSVVAMKLVEDGKIKLDDPAFEIHSLLRQRESRRREKSRGRQQDARAGAVDPAA